MSVILPNQTTPVTPASGSTEIFTSSAKRLSTVDDAGTVRLLVDRTSSEVLSNKSIDDTCEIVNSGDNSKMLQPSLGGMTAAVTLTLSLTQSTSQTLSVPNITGADTIVTTNLAQTVSNKTIASSTGVPYVADATGAGSKKIASSGPIALVTGTKTIASGLTTISSVVVTPAQQPTGTGTASAQILAVTNITTGSFTVTAYSVSSVTGGTVAANTSTGSFYWLAMGT